MKKNMLSRFTVNRLFRFLPSQLRKCDSLSLLCGLPRYICDKPLLKYDLYEKEQKRFRAKVTDLDLFWLRVLSMNNEEKVFDEDLKVAWYLAEEEYLPELMQLTVKYLENCKSYVDHFKFGSLMMRTCHRLNKPDEAFQLFCNPIISRHLDETMSIVILLDLLIDSEKYEEAVYVCDSVLKWEWFFVLRNPLLQLLYIIALYKQGSPEALSKACQLLKRAPVRQSNQRRTENLIFLLAIKLSEKSELAKCVNRPSTSLSEWNLKVQGLALLSQWDVLLSEISDKHDKIFKDTHTLIHELNPQISKQFSKTPLKLKVEDQLLAPITSQEFQGLFDERKKYYG